MPLPLLVLSHRAQLVISCGCIWDGDTRVQTCPAHNRH